MAAGREPEVRYVTVRAPVNWTLIGSGVGLAGVVIMAVGILVLVVDLASFFSWSQNGAPVAGQVSAIDGVDGGVLTVLTMLAIGIVIAAVGEVVGSFRQSAG